MLIKCHPMNLDTKFQLSLSCVQETAVSHLIGPAASSNRVLTCFCLFAE